MADWNLKRRKSERAVAAEIANELHRTLSPTRPEALAEKSDVICKVFGDAFDRHGITESAAERVLSYVPAILADMNLKFAEMNRRLDAAIRPPLS
jgi:hypothetical protein